MLTLHFNLRCYKKAKNAELRGLRFSISFSQMRNELGCKGYLQTKNKKIRRSLYEKLRKTKNKESENNPYGR